MSNLGTVLGVLGSAVAAYFGVVWIKNETKRPPSRDQAGRLVTVANRGLIVIGGAIGLGLPLLLTIRLAQQLNAMRGPEVAGLGVVLAGFVGLGVLVARAGFGDRVAFDSTGISSLHTGQAKQVTRWTTIRRARYSGPVPKLVLERDDGATIRVGVLNGGVEALLRQLERRADLQSSSKAIQDVRGFLSAL